MSMAREGVLREGCKPRPLFKTPRLSGVAALERRASYNPLFSKGLSVPTGRFTLFSGLPFSVRPVFSVLTGPSPKVVQLIHLISRN